VGRLVVVSNRVPLPDKQGKAPAGGLAVALQAALNVRGGVWFGWSGETLSGRETHQLETKQVGPISYALLSLQKKDIDEYYAGFANRMLWPLCHYRLDLIDYTRKDMAGYFRVNRLFAQQLLPLIEPDDTIWVHDYHLIPLAEELRRCGVENRIGFFMHIPWPPADLLLTLPVHEAIIRGLTYYDLVGFQTENDVENFIGGLRREKIGKQIEPRRFEAFGRSFSVDSFGIGIETEAFAEIAMKTQNSSSVKRMRDSMSGRDLIIGVDRLDYSKGITNRLEAFENFLKIDPVNRGHVTFLQVTPKSRTEVPEYKDMQREVAEMAGRINGANATFDWTPIRYINRSLNRDVLAGLYRLAKVGLVTPLRDGMNLVAKEYVAAQDPDDPGVLVLSRFAGAAQELDGAVLVNPYDTEAVAYAIARALSMPLEERQERYNDMMDFLKTHDVTRWCDDFLARLAPEK